MTLENAYSALAVVYGIGLESLMLHLVQINNELEDKIEIQMDAWDEHNVALVYHHIDFYCYDNKLEQSMHNALIACISVGLGHSIKEQEDEEDGNTMFEMSPNPPLVRAVFAIEPFTFARPHQHWTPDHWRYAVEHEETELSYHSWVTERMASNDLPRELPYQY